jgi:hypothetical protein
VLKKVLFDKFFDIIKQRKEKIKGEIAQAEKLRKEANALKEEYTRKMDEARTASDECYPGPKGSLKRSCARLVKRPNRKYRECIRLPKFKSTRNEKRQWKM